MHGCIPGGGSPSGVVLHLGGCAWPSRGGVCMAKGVHAWPRGVHAMVKGVCVASWGGVHLG